jgi:hypothetical protein
LLSAVRARAKRRKRAKREKKRKRATIRNSRGPPKS